MLMNDKDKPTNMAKEIAKYAFALAFYLEYQKAEIEISRCEANLRNCVEEFLQYSKELTKK